MDIIMGRNFAVDGDMRAKNGWTLILIVILTVACAVAAFTGIGSGEKKILKPLGEDLSLGGWWSFYRNFKNVRWHIDPSLNYHHFNNSSDLASATFNAPVADVSRQLLNDLFSPNASRINLRDTLVNRILRQGSGRGHTWDGTLHTGATIKIPHTNENLRLGAGINLIGREEKMFDKQEVKIPDSPESSSSFNHFRDNHPTRDGKAYFNIGYNIPLGEGWRSIHAMMKSTIPR